MRLTDNLKTLTLSDMPAEAWQWILGSDENESNVISFYKHVPWLYRAINLRMDAVKRMPLTVTRGGETLPLEEIDLNERMKYKMRLRDTLALWEGHLALYGAAYGDAERNRVNKSRGFRALHPTTIKPKIDRINGLTGWERTIGGMTIPHDLEDYVYVWLPNLEAEIGPGTSPAVAALNAAGLLRNMQMHANNKFKNGMLKSMLMVVPDTIKDTEKERLQSFAQRILSIGVKGKPGIQAVSSDVEFKEVGEDLADLALPELTQTQREDVATALGVPQTMLFSNAANYATSQQDYRQFYDTTIIPDMDRLLDALNEQLFEPMGFIVNEAHEQLEFYQDDKESESMILLEGVDVGGISIDEYRTRMDMEPMTDETRTQILEWMRLIAQAKGQKGVASQQPVTIAQDDNKPDPDPNTPPQDDTPEDDAQDDESRKGIDPADIGRELAQWRKYALNRLPGDIGGFTPEVTPALYADIVSKSLEGATTADEVKAVFKQARELLLDGFTRDAVAPVETEPPEADEAKTVGQWAEESLKSIQETYFKFEDEYNSILDAARNGDLNRRQWAVRMRTLIRKCGNLAFVDGLKDGGVEDGDMSDDDKAEVNRLVAEQSQYVTNLGATLFSEDGITDEEALNKADMWWRKSITPFYDAGRLSADSNGYYEWVLGQTSEQCDTCQSASGQIHRLRDWHRRGILPRTDVLLCEGFNCKCNLVKQENASARGSLSAIPTKHFHMDEIETDEDHNHDDIAD